MRRITGAITRLMCGQAARAVVAIASAATLLAPAPCFAGEDKAGVSPSRLKLPKGPGSLEGIGENAEPNLTMGLMTYGVPIAVPSGYGALTPSLRLAYSSGAGNSEVGIGWSLAVPSIERMTSKGLPAYGVDDLIAGGGSDELVRVDSAANVYRARYEGGFVRYAWVDKDHDGKAGYWMAEYPDGRVGWFGADADGHVDANAEVVGPSGVFRWHLVEMTDPLGHSVRYEYQKDGSYSLLKRISWVFEGGSSKRTGTPRYVVLLGYEDRADHISDLKPRFRVELSKRLSDVIVLSHDQQLRRYAFTYGAGAAGISRLGRVEQFGLNDAGPYPIDFRFTYSDDAAANCSGSCDTPQVHAMGHVAGGAFRNGTADLVDMNGDGLPDVIDTATSLGRHQIYLNDWAGAGGFAGALPSKWGTSGFDLSSSARVQTLDLDGNGFSDLVVANGGATSQALFGEGTTDGDWAPGPMNSGASFVPLPDFSAFGSNFRFFDYDNDKRIDILKWGGGTTSVLINGAWNEKVVDDVGVSDGSALQLADMNGDGLLDIVRVLQDEVAYRLHLGLGHFTPEWTEMAGIPAGDPKTFQVVDINGDGLSDVVIVLGDQVQTALNQNGATFLPVQVLDSTAHVPERTSDTSIRFADMNGNGSTDVVWVQADGKVTFLDLHPVRPNLITRIQSGIGKVVDVKYGSSVDHMQTDGGAAMWKHRLPHPMLTVDQIDTWDTASKVRQTRQFHYSNPFYDGEEKQFRGFADVAVTTPGDANVETGVVVHHFEIGETDSYRRNLAIAQEIYTQGKAVLLSKESRTYDDCTVGGVSSSLTPKVRYICETQVDHTTLEGKSASSGVTTRERYVYDGYGNRTRVLKDGVVNIGGGACGTCQHPGTFGAPCGGQCLGDEHIEETDFVPPTATAGLWMIHQACQKREYGVVGGSTSTLERYYYDGLDSSPCSLTTGLRTRTVAQVDASGSVINREVLQYDARGDGAVVATTDPNGHKRQFTYDSANLLLTSEEILFDDASRTEKYTLRMDAQYHPVLELVSASSHWRKYFGGIPAACQNGQSAGCERWTYYGYDEFGRLTGIARPGDSLGAPTEEYAYVLADPVSRIVKHARSQHGGGVDTEEIQCFDGLGRKFQTRTLIAPGSYQVTGHVGYDAQGDEARKYQPWRASDYACELVAPAGTKFTESKLDATERVVTTTMADAAIYGSASYTSTVYEPLRTTVYDENDNDSSNELANGTPTTTVVDGLGRTTSIIRRIRDSAGAMARDIPLDVTYDELGRLRGYVDKNGNEKVQAYDLLGRVIQVDDPDSHRTTFAYDAAGNVTSQTDARPKTRRAAFDEANRIVGEWDDADKTGTLITYEYDAPGTCSGDKCANLEGKLARVTYPMEQQPGVDLMGYDTRGEATYLSRTLDGHPFEIATTRDNLERVARVAYPASLSVEYQYDGLGRVSQVPTYVPQVTYDDHGQLESMTYGNGVVTTYAYDDVMRLKSILAQSPVANVVEDLKYTRDRVGNIMMVADSALDGEQPSSNAEYAYDSLYRLTSARLDSGRKVEETITIGYDDIDNITSKTSDKGAASPDHVGAYKYGENGAGPHALTTAGSQKRTYEPSGETRSAGTNALKWDHLGRLSSVSSGTRTIAKYAFGAGDLQVAKYEEGAAQYQLDGACDVRGSTVRMRVSVGGATVALVETAAGVTTAAAMDVSPVTANSISADARVTAGDAWIAQASGNGWVVVSVGSDTDEVLTAAAREALTGGTRTTYVACDQLGSVESTVLSDATIESRFATSPSGTSRTPVSGVDELARRTGKEFDRATGLIDFGVRQYDPVAQTWLSTDESFATIRTSHDLADRQAINRYGYANQNPIIYRDPSGRWAIVDNLAGAVVGAAVSGSVELASQFLTKKSGEGFKWDKVVKEVGYGAATGFLTSGISVVAKAGKGVELSGKLLSELGAAGLNDFKGKIVDKAAEKLAPKAAGQLAEMAGEAVGGEDLAASWKSGVEKKVKAAFEINNIRKSIEKAGAGGEKLVGQIGAWMLKGAKAINERGAAAESLPPSADSAPQQSRGALR